MSALYKSSECIPVLWPLLPGDELSRGILTGFEKSVREKWTRLAIAWHIHNLLAAGPLYPRPPAHASEGGREGALYCYLRGGRTKEPVKTRGKRRKTGEGGDPPTDHATQHTTRISFDTPLLLLPLPIAWPGFCVAAQSKAVDFCRCQVQGEMIFW